jgi:hypothetical protein
VALNPRFLIFAKPSIAKTCFSRRDKRAGYFSGPLFLAVDGIVRFHGPLAAAQTLGQSHYSNVALRNADDF